MAACGRCNATTRADDCGDGAALLKCGRCKIISYCSTGCQRLHWKVHKAACLTRKEQEISRSVARATTVKDCYFCKRTKKAGEKAFSSCARCRAVRYCSSECQKKDWGTHKDACASREKSKAPTQNTQRTHKAHSSKKSKHIQSTHKEHAKHIQSPLTSYTQQSTHTNHTNHTQHTH